MDINTSIFSVLFAVSSRIAGTPLAKRHAINVDYELIMGDAFFYYRESFVENFLRNHMVLSENLYLVILMSYQEKLLEYTIKISKFLKISSFFAY